MFRFGVLLVTFLALTSQVSADIKWNNPGSGSGYKPVQLLKDLVTKKIAAGELSDEDLCLSLKFLDLPSTFYEHQKRGLDCLAIKNPQKRWAMPTRDEAFKYLKQYKRIYKIAMPSFSLEGSRPSFGNLEKTASTYQKLNQKFKRDFSEQNKISYRMQFCLDWFGNVNYVAENQSKNLDGSFGWKDDTLRDGFVVCQDEFNKIYLRALNDKGIRDQLEQMLLSWINNDGLRRDVETDKNIFGQVLLFNKASIAIEMYHSSFDWSEEQNKKLSKWLNDRVVEMFPIDKRPLSKKCPVNSKVSGFKKLESCKNGGILRAQALLRVAIWNKDPELVEMAYLTFHRYMTGIREDGSNVADSTRGCAAADYNIWASQFMSDFLFHWDRIGKPLWDTQFINNSTPADAVEYSLSLFGNFESINKHTTRKHWDNCDVYKAKKEQEASKRYEEGFYPRVSFSPYFQYNGDLLNELKNYDRLSELNYTAQSGANYEIALINLNPILEKALNIYIAKRNEQEKQAIAKLKEQEKQAIAKLKEQEKQARKLETAKNQARIKEQAKKIQQKKEQLKIQIRKLENNILGKFDFNSGTQFTLTSSIYQVPNSTLFVIDEKEAPQIRKVNSAEEKKKIHASFMVGLMNEGKISGTSLIPKTISNFGSLITLMEYDGNEISQTTSIGIATGHLKKLAGDLSEINKLSAKQCGSLPGKLSKPGAYEWIFVVTNTKDRQIVKQQDCVLNVFLSQQNHVSEFYKGLLMISTNLENYVNAVQ